MSGTLVVALLAAAAAVVLFLRLRRQSAQSGRRERELAELRARIDRQENSIATQNVFAQGVFESLSEGLIAITPRGRVAVANERARSIFGRPDVIGKSLPELARKPSLLAAVDRALRGESSSERMTMNIGGTERQVELRVTPVSGSPEIAAVALIIDITQLERLQRVRKDFLDDFSHEVRTPLAGLRSAVETLEHGPLPVEQEDQLRKVISRQLGRIERLVKDLSELNRIESGELVLERRDVDLRSVLGELCDDFRQRLADKPVIFTVRGEETHARLDPARAQQIFSNLLDNAWRHGGTSGEILVELGVENGQAVVKISDEGEGIPPQEIDRIFNRFYRVDKSRSQSLAGVGLGLAITKHLVLLHGGTIRAYNRPAGGATFEVRLPRA